MIGEMVLYDNGIDVAPSVGVVLQTWQTPTGQIWIECLWDDGEIDSIDSGEISFVKKVVDESR